MAGENHPEPDIEEVAVQAHARKARHATQEKLPEDIEVEVVHKTLAEEERVPRNSTIFTRVGSLSSSVA